LEGNKEIRALSSEESCTHAGCCQNLLGFCTHFAEVDEEKKHLIVLARLLSSTYQIGVALHLDEYWQKLRLQ
jgi:hypothetical protein